MTDIGGIPAKLIKMRFTEEEIKEHERRMVIQMC
jgi:acetyltransferase-like isoleucine patch superfamily enzyme